MNKFGTYKVSPSNKLIVEYYSGTITINDLFHFKNVISKETNYNFYFNTICDFRDCDLVLTKDDLKLLDEFLEKKFHNNINSRKVGYLVNSPKSAALGFIYSMVPKKFNLSQKVFSTVEGAVTWFNDELFDEKLIAEILKKLKTQSKNVFTQ